MSDKRDIIRNKKAEHNFFIDDRYEAGLVLTGTEVKSLRAHKANLVDSFARVNKGEVWLHNMHISPYSHGNIHNHEPMRTRKMLMHKAEIRRLIGKTKEKGYTLVPLRVYFLGNKVKVEIGLGRGKKLFDKRKTIAEKTAKRDMERVFREKQKE